MTPTLNDLRNDIETARKAFRAYCRTILREAYEDAEYLSSAVGEISADEAYQGWKRQLIEKLDRS